MFKKIISLILSLSLIITQPIFAQGLAQLNLAQYLGQARPMATDSFRPTQLRYFSYNNLNNSFRILLDKGDTKDIKDSQLKEQAKELMDYFLIGVTLPNDAFWVNLRPDSPDNIINPELEQTSLGKILLEADLQLKKDTASRTSPQTPEGQAYWDKLYKKAGELFGTENITIPTLTRPWIVPNEIIIREAAGEASGTERVQTSRSTPDNGSTTLTTSAYIYKATLKVMLEEDYLTSRGGSQPAPTSALSSQQYEFKDPRLKELNEYSTQLIKELIIPKLTYQVNTAKRYALLRQVYYSLILAQWFKQKLRDGSFKESVIFKNRPFSGRTIPKKDSGDLTNLVAKQPYDKQDYFKQYQQSFKDGEYNLTESIYTPYGQSIRRYMSGGMNWENLISSPIMPVSGKPLLFRKYFPYLISLLVTFNFVPGVEAVTISKVYAPNNYSLGYKGVVEDEKTLEELLRNILGQYGIHNLSASEKILSDIHKENPHLGQYPLRPGTSVRITKLIESILTGIFLSECKIISKGSITVAGRLHEVYIVTKNTGIPFKSVALTLGGTIFINEKNVVKQSEIIVGELYKGLPPKIKREDIHRIIVEMTTVHEKMHLLLKRWLEEGLELSPLLISELQKLGELTQEEKNDTIQELSAYLVEIWYYGNVLSGKYEKSEYYEELCKYAIRATLKTLSGLKHLRGVAEIIDSMGLISQEMVRKLPLGEIQKVVGTAFEGLFGQEIPNDLRNGAWPANDNNKYNDAGQKDGSKSDGMVKISLNPALFPKIRDDVRREIQYLDFKTLNEVLKYLGLEGNKDMVIRLKKREGAQQQYPGKILLERVEILPGDEIIINPTKGTGSSLLSGKVLVQSPPAMETGSKSNSLTQEKNSYNKKEDMSSASSAISPRLNDLLMSIKHETDPESIDEKVKEIFAILREDSVER